MKNFSLIFVAAFSVLMAGCTSRSIEGGEVGVFIDKPYVFGSGGVREEIHHSGRAITWLSTDVVTMPTAPITFTIHVDDMMTLNKVPLDFDIAVTLEMESPEVAPVLMKKFNGGALEAFSRLMMPGIDYRTMLAKNPSGEFMSAFRDEVRQRHMDAFLIATDGNGVHVDANKDIEKGMVKYTNDFLKKEGVPVRVRNVALGHANPPDEVKSALARTAEQIQLKTTEGAREQAQIARKKAEEASAAADHAQQLKLGFTNQEYLKKLELETIQKVCVSGHCTMIVGQAVPTITVK